MLNPKLIEIYGEESREKFDNLISELGINLAGTCYVVSGCANTYISGVRLPNFMISTEDNVSAINDALRRYAKKYGSQDDEFWIMVFTDSVQKEDIQLWV